MWVNPEKKLNQRGFKEYYVKGMLNIFFELSNTEIEKLYTKYN